MKLIELLLSKHDKKVRSEAVLAYKKALWELLDDEKCIHHVDLKIEADRVIDGF